MVVLVILYVTLVVPAMRLHQDYVRDDLDGETRELGEEHRREPLPVRLSTTGSSFNKRMLAASASCAWTRTRWCLQGNLASVATEAGSRSGRGACRSTLCAPACRVTWLFMGAQQWNGLIGTSSTLKPCGV